MTAKLKWFVYQGMRGGMVNIFLEIDIYLLCLTQQQVAKTHKVFEI